MKQTNILNLVVAAAAAIMLCAGCANDSGKAAAEQNEAIDNIMTRTSIRAYTDQEVTDETVETLLRAAMAAPSAGNKQPWRFVVVRDREELVRFADAYRTMDHVRSAALAIVVCGDMEDTFPGDGLDYWVEDTSAATENLLLAAHSLGLGAVWCGIYPLPERVNFLKDELQLPENIVPLGVVSLGYPAEAPAPKDKWNPDYVYNERWDPTREVALRNPW